MNCGDVIFQNTDALQTSIRAVFQELLNSRPISRF